MIFALALTTLLNLANHSGWLGGYPPNTTTGFAVRFRFFYTMESGGDGSMARMPTMPHTISAMQHVRETGFFAVHSRGGMVHVELFTPNKPGTYKQDKRSSSTKRVVRLEGQISQLV